MQLKSLHTADLKGKRVLLRADLNVPLHNGVVQDDSRILGLLPTLQYLLEEGASVIVASHLGRPKGNISDELRLGPIAEALSEALGQPVLKLDDCVGPSVQQAVDAMNAGDVILLENTRFHPEEKSNDAEFSRQLATLADLYVNDAFGTLHRGHASTLGVTQYLPSYAGLLVEREVTVLSELLNHPKHPMMLIVGGAKIDTKIGILEQFLTTADVFVIGGALANTFLLAQGFEVGSSLVQEDKVELAREFMTKADSLGKMVILPKDVVVAHDIAEDAVATSVSPDSIGPEDKVLDIGPQTLERISEAIESTESVIWNGPMGLYEFAPFASGTQGVLNALSACNAEVVVGGGDSVDAIKKLGGRTEDFAHISTGGGAMLEFLEGKTLPALEPLLA